MDQFSKKVLAASIVLAFGLAGNAWAAESASDGVTKNVTVEDGVDANRAKGASNAVANGGSTSSSADSSNSSNTTTADNNGNDNSTNNRTKSVDASNSSTNTADNNGNDNSTSNRTKK